jgi:thiol-disulfide isomerase/thioredoxin
MRYLMLTAGLLLAAAITFATEGQDDTVPTLGAQDIKSLVQDYQGKVVVLNFWATWCPPCIKEFPDIIKLHNQYQSKGVEVIAVSMNEADEIEDIKAFIEKYQPPFSIYRASSTEETFYQEFDKNWFGQMPTTVIYDTTGKVARLHMKPITYPELEQYVVAALTP